MCDINTNSYSFHNTVADAKKLLEVREILDCLRTELLDGKYWPCALFEAVGRWPLPYETIDGNRHQYLLLGEAFDWMRLAGRLLQEVDELIPDHEKEDLLFDSKFPTGILESQFKGLIGSDKYRAHLNYFYGVVVEDSLILAMEERVIKEWKTRGISRTSDVTDLAMRYIYGSTQADLLKEFRISLERPQASNISFTELKEFTYWLFKRRVDLSESSRVASDTKIGLDRTLRSSHMVSPFMI